MLPPKRPLPPKSLSKSDPQNKNPLQNNPSKNISREKIWSLKNIRLALFIGFTLIILDLILIFLLNTSLSSSLIILLITVIIYAISLYFLLNPPYESIIQKEKVRKIEKPTIKVVEKIIEKPVKQIVEKPIEKIKYIEKPSIQKISKPILIPPKDDPMDKYPYVASTKSKKIHSTKTTAGRMIKPENREYSHKVTNLKKKGYTEGNLKPNKKYSQ
jgi:hypothetical protein